MICKRCRKVFEVFFCPECTELSIEKLAEMMEKALEKKGQNLTSRQSRVTDSCGCKSATRKQCAFWDGEGGCVHPPPA